MGVHGLTTFLRENKRSLCTTTTLESRNAAKLAKDTPTASTETLVVDGWSFIYTLHADAGLPWVYGGEYTEFTRLVTAVVEAWIAVGIRPIFVFDGAYPPAKFDTAIRRRQTSRISPAQLFFRTSPAARGSPSFLNASANKIIPPMLLEATLAGLSAVTLPLPLSAEDGDGGDGGGGRGIEVHMADGEADTHVVALAARLGARVTGLDSDFAVMTAEGYMGYVPLDEMVWSTTTAATTEVDPEAESRPMMEDGEGDGFTPARTPKSKKRPPKGALERGLIPPPYIASSPPTSSNTLPSQTHTQILTLTFPTYTPQTLASHLSLPPPLLPLHGALLGNDYTSPPHRALFSRSGRMGPAQRVGWVSAILAGLLQAPPSVTGNAANNVKSNASGKGKEKRKRPGSVLELIQFAVAEMIGPHSNVVSAAEQAGIVERIVDGTLMHAINVDDIHPPEPDEENEIAEFDVDGLDAPPCCALHTPSTCPLSLSFLSPTPTPSSPNLSPDQSSALAQYLRDHHHALLHPLLLDVLTTRTAWPDLGLEDPDRKSPARVLGGVRRAVYAVVRDAGGVWGEEVADEELGEGDGREEEEDEGGKAEEEDEDEVIDVVEEHSDEEDVDVEVLRGALRRLNPNPSSSSVDDPPNDVQEIVQDQDQEPTEDKKKKTKRLPATITEYVRKGSRIVPEEVVVPSLYDLFEEVGFTLSSPSSPAISSTPTPTPIPIILHPTPTRLAALLALLHSNHPLIAALNPEWLRPLLAVRAAVRAAAEAAGDSNGNGSAMERWTRSEAVAAVMAFASPPGVENENGQGNEQQQMIPVEPRAIQRTAQLLSALDAVSSLASALRVSDNLPLCVSRFSGTRFHALLSAQSAHPSRSFPGLDGGDDASDSASVSVSAASESDFGDHATGREGGDGLDDVISATIEDLDAFFAPDAVPRGRRGKKARKVARAKDNINGGGGVDGKTLVKGGRGMYGLLADLGDE
ncbi:hypothetical protein BD410DRAFT_902972 [Rickenella mellea]|uniref:Uncharacterized protein n=1 Tax=Rickenella mellea TaxID=50990 RepID=A0A4Y7PGQ7_9AGAM|nr:hypothetical protein BD410DRAFT_902972 [Rickenella mellea]